MEIFTNKGDVKFSGFIRIAQVDPKTGQSTLLLEKPNLALYQSCDILARALAGVSDSGISHMYVGFKNAATTPTYDKTVLRTNADPMTGYTTPYGYLRLALSFPPSYTTSGTDFVANIPVFTVMVTSSSTSGGATFNPGSGTYSWIAEVASVVATNPASPSADMTFARVLFSPIKFDPAYNLTISWGTKFTISE